MDEMQPAAAEGSPAPLRSGNAGAAAVNEDPLVIAELPGGEPGAFPLPEVLAAKKRYQELFGHSVPQRERDLNRAEPLMDSTQLGKFLGCDSTTCEQMARDGRLPSLRIGRLLRFEPAVCIARLRVTDGGAL